MNFWYYGLSWRNLAKLKDKLPHLNTRVQEGAGKAEKLDTAIIITSASSKNVEKTSSISSSTLKVMVWKRIWKTLKNHGEFWVYILGDFRPKVQLQLRCQKPTPHHVEPQTVEDRDFPGTGIIRKIYLHNFKSCPLLSYVPFKQSCILATDVSIFSWFPYGISLNCWKHPLIPLRHQHMPGRPSWCQTWTVPVQHFTHWGTHHRKVQQKNSQQIAEHHPWENMSLFMF